MWNWMKQIKLRLHIWPEEILRKKSEPVTEFDGSMKAVFEEMTSLMKVCDGVGLAANQAGLKKSLAVIEFQGKVYRLINPRITGRKGRMKFKEGCLSFPGIEINIRRSARVWVGYQDEKGDSCELCGEGILAVILQHEVDHLQGKTIIDRASLWQKLKLIPKLRKITGDTKQRLAVS